jgi:molybdate transport system ATP-binding protein
MADGEVLTQPLGASERIAYLGPERQDRYERYESELTVEQVVHTGFDDSDFPLSPQTAAQSRNINAVLQGVGLAGLARRKFRSLSYGQRRRVLLARALVRRPDVLLLDEALNGLDAAARRAFLLALRRAVSQRTAWILSTHRHFASPLGNTHTARMDSGRLVRVPSFQALPAAGTASLAARQRAVRGHRTLRGVEGSQVVRPLLRLKAARVFRDGQLVIGRFSWTLRAGEHWHVTGANGSGKSTFMALLYGDLWPALGGVLERGGQPHSGRCVTPIEDWKRSVGLVSPELQAAYAATGCTVEEILVSGLHSSIGLDALPTARESRIVQRSLRDWNLGAYAQRRARELSYGQLRLVLVARAFITRRRLYLLDEPFDGLDALARELVRSRLDAIRSAGATVVIATHHAEDVPPWIATRLRMRAGRAPITEPAPGYKGRAAS